MQRISPRHRMSSLVGAVIAVLTVVAVLTPAPAVALPKSAAAASSTSVQPTSIATGYAPLVNVYSSGSSRCLRTFQASTTAQIGFCQAQGTAADYTSMRMWAAGDNGDGYVLLTNQYKGTVTGGDPNRCLRTFDSSLGYKVEVGACAGTGTAADYTSMRLWKVLPQSDGTFKLQNKYRADLGANACLATFATNSGLTWGSCGSSDTQGLLRWSSDPRVTAAVVTVQPQIAAAVAARSENRWLTHSDLQPTGRFVRAGQQLMITVPGGGSSADSLQVGIGLYGPYAAWNNGSNVGIAYTNLVVGQNAVTASRDGMVYLTNRNGSASQVVTVTGGEAVPMWTLGTTTVAQWDAELREYPTAPFVSLVGNRIFGDFQRGPAVQALAGVNIANLLTSWDTVIQYSNDVYGLKDNAVGVARRYPSRVFIANPDSGPGYASATNGYITFQVNTDAGAALLNGSDEWGLWHEVGHTYQTPQYTWGGLGEITVNISSLAIQARLGQPSRLDGPVIQSEINAFFATPVAQRSYDAISSGWVKLLMFDQLRRAFGNTFYPWLSQTYRNGIAFGDPNPGTTAEKQQVFALTASKVVGRNLIPFFQQWGIPLTAQTQAVLASYPALFTPIWLNTVSTHVYIDISAPPYILPTANVTLPGMPSQFTFGADYTSLLPGVSVTSPGATQGTGPVFRGRTAAITHRLGALAGWVAVELVGQYGADTVLLRADVVAGNLLEFRGYGNEPIAYVGLSTQTGRLLVISTGTEAHSSFAGSVYFSMKLISPSGQTIASADVHGDQGANQFAAAGWDAAPYDGAYLVVTHREPQNRFVRYSGGVQQPGSTSQTQAFHLVGNAFVPVSLAEVPGGH